MNTHTYKLTCCSTADMPLSWFQEKDIPFVCFHFHLNDSDYPDDLGQSMPFASFYQKIADGAMPTTSQVNIEEFLAFFEPILKDGMDILHISFSSGLSGSYNSACAAREELAEKYPERTIKIVDSLGASSGYGLIVDTAWTMREDGASLDELYNWLEENRLRMHHWFFSTDLTHYKRGGRISPAAAAFGSILNICPLMNMNDRGELIPRKKIRGKKSVIAQMEKMMEEHAQDGLQYAQKCFISNSACEDDARQVAELIENTFPNLEGKVMINSVGTVIGAHTGPGTVALFFWGDKRTD